MTDIQDFSLPGKDSLKFRINDDIFEAVPYLGASLLNDVLDMTDAITLSNFDGTGTSEQIGRATAIATAQMNKAVAFLDTVLIGDSAERFAARLRSTDNPISFNQVFEIWQWLVGQYANRPTQPSSPSVNGHDGTGMSSTAGALPAG